MTLQRPADVPLCATKPERVQRDRELSNELDTAHYLQSPPEMRGNHQADAQAIGACATPWHAIFRIDVVLRGPPCQA